jgi:hypothetical protein
MTPAYQPYSEVESSKPSFADSPNSAAQGSQDHSQVRHTVEPNVGLLPLFARLIRAVRAEDGSQIDTLRDQLDGLGWSISHRSENTAGVEEVSPKPVPPAKTADPTERLAGSIVRLALAGLEPVVEIDDLAVLFGCSRREVERLRAGGKLPPPDLKLGKSPKWLPTTVRNWLQKQAKGGGR